MRHNEKKCERWSVSITAASLILRFAEATVFQKHFFILGFKVLTQKLSVYYNLLLRGRWLSAVSLQSFDPMVLCQDFHLTDGDGVEFRQPLGL